MVFFILLLVVIAVTVGYGWVKGVTAIFKKFQPKENPYVQAHRIKMNNDLLYSEYLRWLDMEGGDMPFEKWKTEEEEKFYNYFRNASSE